MNKDCKIIKLESSILMNSEMEKSCLGCSEKFFNHLIDMFKVNPNFYAADKHVLQKSFMTYLIGPGDVITNIL